MQQEIVHYCELVLNSIVRLKLGTELLLLWPTLFAELDDLLTDRIIHLSCLIYRKARVSSLEMKEL